MNIAIVLAFLFFIGCVAGWGIELLFRRFYTKDNPEHRWVNPGFLTGPWLPIYGFGLCGMYFISELLSAALKPPGAWDVVIILVTMMIVMTLIELVAGLFFTRYEHVWLWDYRNEKLNFKGVICLKFSIFWGLLGCFYYFVINPYVLDGIIWLSQHLTFSFFIGMFFGVFAVDLVHANQMISKVKAFADEKQIVVRYGEFKEELRKRREELEHKSRFFMGYRPEHSIRKSLEEYVEKHGLLQPLDELKERIEEIEEEVRKIKQ